MNCPHCFTSFIPTRLTQVYCGPTCKHLAKDMRKYHKEKDTNSDWYCNRRARELEYQRNIREDRFEKGLCVRCGDEMPSERSGMRTCNECSTKVK